MNETETNRECITYQAGPLLEMVQGWVNDTELSPTGVMEKTVALLQEQCPLFHWVGIYLLEGDELVLGPYVGKPTDHCRIPVGVGVCGTAVAENKNQIIDDVRTLENYLACSLETRSEIVVLIRSNETPSRVLGQIDIDSDQSNAFNTRDEEFLGNVAELLARRLT